MLFCLPIFIRNNSLFDRNEISLHCLFIVIYLVFVEIQWLFFDCVLDLFFIDIWIDFNADQRWRCYFITRQSISNDNTYLEGHEIKRGQCMENSSNSSKHSIQCYCIVLSSSAIAFEYKKIWKKKIYKL